MHQIKYQGDTPAEAESEAEVNQVQLRKSSTPITTHPVALLGVINYNSYS